MKGREYRIGPGAASLLLVIVVVSMSLLGLLALAEARGDYRLTRRSMEFSAMEYGASAEAQRSLAALDGVLAACAEGAADDGEYLESVMAALPEGMEPEGRIVRWTEETGGGRTLYCAVEVARLGSDVRYVWLEHAFAADGGEEFF